MAAVTRAQAQAAAILIRDEVAANANTATRVGTTLLNQADSLLFSGDGSALADRTILKSAIGTGTDSGLVLHNPSVAGAGTHQYSPAVTLQGEGFIAGARRELYLRAQLRTNTGATALPVLAIQLGDAAESTTADAASLTDVALLGTTTLALQNGLNLSVPGVVSIGASPAATGQIRAGDSWSIVGKTAAAADQIVLSWGISGADVLALGAFGTDVDRIELLAVDRIDLYVNDALQSRLTDTALDLQNNNIVTTGTLSVGASPAGFGGVRLPKLEANGAWFANDAGTDSVMGLALAAANVLLLGGAGAVAGASSPDKIIANAVTHHEHRISDATKSVLTATALNLQGIDANFAIQGNGEAMIGLHIAAAGVRNLAIHNDGSAAMNSMDGGVFWASAVVVPAAAPSGGGYEWYDDDGNKWSMNEAGVSSQLTP